MVFHAWVLCLLALGALSVSCYVEENGAKAVYKPYTFVERDLPYMRPKPEWWTTDRSVRPYKVFLCLDGGALKGIVPTTVLIELEKQIKTHIINHLDHFEAYKIKSGKTKEDYNFNTVNDFLIDIADFFDGIAGISAGSWITAYLVTKGGMGATDAVLQRPSIVNRYGSHKAGSLQGLRVFFLEYGDTIYPPVRIPFTIKPKGPFVLPGVGIKSLTEAQYSPKGLEWVLKLFLGDTRLSEVATSMLVAAFDLYRLSAIEFIADYLDLKPGDARKPEIFTGIAISKIEKNYIDASHLVTPIRSESNSGGVDDGLNELPPAVRTEFQGMDKIYDLDYYVRDIVRSSSAFPMLHPSKLLKPLNDITNYFDMIDGALVGNNPTLPTLAWALTHSCVETLEHTAYLSLGTGFVRGSYEKLGTGGTLQWQGPIIDLAMSSTPEFLHAIMDYVFYKNHLDSSAVKMNQLMRVQLIRDAGTEDGDLIGQAALTRDDLLKLEGMAELLAAKYRDSMVQFVTDFMMYHHDKSEGPEAPAPAPSHLH